MKKEERAGSAADDYSYHGGPTIFRLCWQTALAVCAPFGNEDPAQAKPQLVTNWTKGNPTC